MYNPLVRALVSIGLTLLFGLIKRQQVSRIRPVAAAWAKVGTVIEAAGADRDVTLAEAGDIQKAVEQAIQETRSLIGR